MTIGELIDRNPDPDITIYVWNSTRIMQTAVYTREFGIESTGRGGENNRWRKLIPKVIRAVRLKNGELIIEAELGD